MDEQPKNAAIAIHGQFIKDLSLEIPHAPEIFSEIKSAPKMDVHIDVKSEPKGNGMFTSQLDIAMTGKIEEKTLFCKKESAKIYEKFITKRKTTEIISAWRDFSKISKIKIENETAREKYKKIKKNPAKYCAKSTEPNWSKNSGKIKRGIKDAKSSKIIEKNVERILCHGEKGSDRLFSE